MAVPLSSMRYFGGDIHVQSMHGFGTDVYLNVNHLGDVLESDGSERHARLVASWKWLEWTKSEQVCIAMALNLDKQWLRLVGLVEILVFPIASIVSTSCFRTLLGWPYVCQLRVMCHIRTLFDPVRYFWILEDMPWYASLPLFLNICNVRIYTICCFGDVFHFGCTLWPMVLSLLCVTPLCEISSDGIVVQMWWYSDCGVPIQEGFEASPTCNICTSTLIHWDTLT